jgi:hypothetical protein
MDELKSTIGTELEDSMLSPIGDHVPECLVEAHTPCASPTEDDDEQLQELEELGKEIDSVRKHQDWLREPNVKKKITSDPRYILYRLPLTDTQREAVYTAVMKERNDKENE